MSSGIKVAQAGGSVDEVADYQTVLTSTFPILPILKTGIAKQNEIVEHNLGYFAPYLFFVKTAYTQGFVIFLDVEDKFTRETLSFGGFFSDPDMEVFYVIFDYNLEIPFNANKNIIGVSNSSSNDSTGVKIPKSTVNTRIESKDPRDFTLTTTARPLAVHINDSFVPVDGTFFTVTHGLGYLPSYLWYNHTASSSGDYISHEFNLVRANSQTIRFRGAQAVLFGTYYYIIFKEPIA